MKASFDKLQAGNRFIYNGARLMKLSAELCNFDNLCDSHRVTHVFKHEESGYEATARLAIVFNVVNLDTGALMSLLNDTVVEITESVDGEDVVFEDGIPPIQSKYSL